jgi:4-amino-4-deoxy-L-arabinose transferase-like glycosyltransferase
MKTAMFNKKKILPALVVFLFFCAYILVGYSIYKDYGISADEETDYKRGMISYNRFVGGKAGVYMDACGKLKDVCYYPPLFSMVLYRYAPGGDSQALYWRRHQLTFAFFAFSVFIFFLIGKKIFKDWKLGLLGALFLIISPTIFGNSFYNPKDIPFLSAYVISIYTLLLFLDKKNIFTAILHGIGIGIACSIRTPGLIMIPVTLFFYFLDVYLAKSKWKSYLKAGLFVLTAVVVAVGLVIWFTPLLYTNTIANYIRTFNIFKQYPWNNFQLYMGQNIQGNIPWHYSLVWFTISSPVLYVALFLVGSITLVVRTLKSRIREHFQAMRDLYLAGACGILPIVAVIVEKSTLNTGNRQMYFVYPALLLISLYGFKVLADKLRQKTLHWQVWMSIILIAGLAYPVYFMIRYHPYEYTYFNFLAGSKMSIVKQNFGMDTWGVSVMDGLKYIARTDPSPKITVQVLDNFPRGLLLLPVDDRNRMAVTNITRDPPDYVITIYYFRIKTPIAGKAVYSIVVGDTDILTVYKMNSQ